MKVVRALLVLLIAPRLLFAQERGAVALGEAVAGLDVTTRVLMIGAHPDDEDTQLIAWLARGQQVETGYLSLTRGDGGQNLIGNELGSLLGMIRTEELLAARRIDGGRQFFTRAYDFGFSKTVDETRKHWPEDSLLRDIVTIVRAFKPHIIIAVFSGTPADGHGHHQLSGILAREAFDAAADTVRFPRSKTLALSPWTVQKFYRAARFMPQQATLSFNVGELSPYRGKTYAEIASQSRSQHLSQGFGALERRGTSLDYVKLEASRVGAVGPERTMFDGLRTDWSRFATPAVSIGSTASSVIESLPPMIARVRAVENLAAPEPMVQPLAQLLGALTRARNSLPCGRGLAACVGVVGDLAATLETAEARARTALLSAAGVLVEATAPRELVAVRDSLPVTITVYNQGRQPIVFDSAGAWTFETFGPQAVARGVTVLPDSSAQVTMPIVGGAASVPWWMAIGRRGDVFALPGSGSSAAENIAIGEERIMETHAIAQLTIAGTPVRVEAGPVVNRLADPARGEQRRPVSVVPAISALFDSEVEYARADVGFERTYSIRLHSASTTPRSVTVEVKAPGLVVDTAVRRVAMQPFSDVMLAFKLKGTLPKGRHTISATITSGDEKFIVGYIPLRYEHIRPLRFYRAAAVQLEAVNAQLPKKTSVAYIRGVGDNVATMLGQLGLKVTMVTPEELGDIDLSKFGSVVVGPRAFAASRELVQHARRLQYFARNGGTVVVQYGQQEIQTPGVLPYPVALKAPAERVTEENAPVTLLTPDASVLTTPNRITVADFADWVQERSTYMPTTADPHYQRVFELHDPGEPPNQNSLLIAPMGRGAYVYVTLALFRQLPSGVPGPARLFLNLVGVDGKTPARTLPKP